MAGVFSSTDSGASWTKISTPDLENQSEKRLTLNLRTVVPSVASGEDGQPLAKDPTLRGG